MKRCWTLLVVLGFATGALPTERVFRRAMERVASMDPALASSLYASRAVRLVYEPLLTYDYHARPYQLIPALAGAMPEPGADRKSYLVRLDDAARFQPDSCFGVDADGRPRRRPVTAGDVVFSFKRLGDRRVASPGAWLVEDAIDGMRAFADASLQTERTDYTRPVAGLQVLDARTLRITLTRPMHQFLWYLAMPYTAVVPHEAVACYGEDFGSHAVGSGPYRLREWRRNHRMVFARDPAWHGWRQGAAAIDEHDASMPFDRVVYNVIDDVSTQWLCFLAGELDFLGEVSRDNWDVVVDREGNLAEPLRRRGVSLFTMPSLQVAYVGINMDDPVLGPNRALRQALNCAFDRDAWVRFFNHRVVPCDGPVPPGTDGRLETPFPYAFDLARARALLREAGYPDGINPATGKRLVLTLDLGRTSQDIRESTELMIAFYARVGIALKPLYHNWPTFLRRLASRQSQMFRIGWVGDYPDAENFLQLFYSANVSPGPNRTNYVDPEFDRLYEAACTAPDRTSRNRYWAAAQQRIREACPWIFLNYTKTTSLCNQRVRNYVPSDFAQGAEIHLRTRP